MKAVPLILAFGILFASPCLAAPTVPCPPVVVDKSSGVFFPGKYFRCYKSTSAAQKSGFSSQSSTAERDYTGWWRLALQKTTDSCSSESVQDSAPGTFFLEVRQTPAGVFAGMCPGEDTFVGSKDSGGNGFVVTKSRQYVGDPDCSGANSQVQYTFDFRQLNKPLSKASSVRFTRIKTCLAPGPGTFNCSTVWQGVGFKEKPHKFWPTVPDDLNGFGQSCAQALSMCSGCHASP